MSEENYRHIPKPKQHQQFQIRSAAHRFSIHPQMRLVEYSASNKIMYCPKLVHGLPCGAPIAYRDGWQLESQLQHNKRCHENG